MPPKKSSKKNEDDDGYDVDFETESVDDDRDPHLLDEDEEDSDADEEDEEDSDEEKDEGENADNVFNEFEAQIIGITNRSKILEIANELFDDKLYDKFEEALNQSSEINSSIVLKLARPIIDQYYSELEDDEEDEELLVNEVEKEKTVVSVKNYPSLFAQILSCPEKTAIIGFRSQQIASGAEIYVETYINDTPLSIASRELKENKLPYYLDRRLPDGTYISVKLDNLLDVTPD